MTRRRMAAQRMGVLALLLMVSLTGSGEGEPQTWLRTYRGIYGAFFDVVLTCDQHIVVVGATHHSQGATSLGDVLVAKLSLDGDVVWERTYGGEAHDQGLYVESAADGGFMVLGETESMGAGGRDLYVLRIDADGGLLWETTFGGTRTEWAKDMIALSDGGFLLVAESNSFGDDFDVYLIRLAADGSEVWSTTLDHGDNESATAALEADNGDLFVLAVVSYSGGGSANRYRDTRLYRLDRDGNELWSTLYRGDHKQAGDAMAWTSDGDLVLAGLSELLGQSMTLFDFWLARIDAESGEMQWSKIEGRQYADEYGISMSTGRDGQFLVAGLGPGFPLLKFDESGTLHWIRSAATELVVYAGFAVLDLSDGSYLIPGFRYVQQRSDSFDAVLLRYVDSDTP